MALRDFNLNLNTTPPEMPTEKQPQAEGQNIEESVKEPQAEAPQTEEPPKVEEPHKVEEPPKADTFIENLNKRFNSQFKSDDEIKSIFGLPKKVSEYETKLKESENLAKTIDEYKRRIEELEGDVDPLKYFSSPEAYKAEQLRIKYPKSNPYILQEIAMSDVDNMGDLDVLIKERALFVKDAPPESRLRALILKRYGVDSTLPPEEWDEMAKDEMKLDAAAAREKINTLKNAIELPQIMTKEQRQQAEQETARQKEQAVIPLKNEFSKFDKFSREGIIDFDVPSEYREKLSDMFEAMFVKAGMEPTEENLQSAVELRDALFLLEYLPKIKEVIAKEAETKLQAKIDAELHNIQPPNTATLTDQEEVKNYRGLGDYVRNQFGR